MSVFFAIYTGNTNFVPNLILMYFTEQLCLVKPIVLLYLFALQIKLLANFMQKKCSIKYFLNYIFTAFDLKILFIT